MATETIIHRKSRYLLCVKNAGYEASLERRKAHRALPNSKAESHGADFFVAIELPKEAAPVFAVPDTGQPGDALFGKGVGRRPPTTPRT